jgi:hypothetical protein
LNRYGSPAFASFSHNSCASLCRTSCCHGHAWALIFHVSDIVTLVTQLNCMLQLGSPSQASYRVILCNSLNASNPLPFPGAASDCWLRCGPAATVSDDARRWLEEHVSSVINQFKGFLGLLWCALACWWSADVCARVSRLRECSGLCLPQPCTCRHAGSC